MTPPPPNVALLEDIAERLPDKRQGMILRDLSRRIVINHSCLTDMKFCAQLLNLLERGFVAEQIDDQTNLLIQHSLLCNAAVLYSRATNGGSMYGGRGSIDVTPKLSSDERASHRFIIDFRNKVIAHVHISHDMEGYAWNPSYAVAVDETDGFRLGAVSRPLSMRESIWNHLKKMAPVALESVKANYHRYLDRASVVLEALEDSDPIYASMQDSAKLLGSTESAQAVLGGRKGGSTIGIGRDE
jgi:hypothetical protein